MIIFTILIAVVFLLGALVLYLYASYIEHKGYMRGLDEAEEIIRECKDGREERRNMARGRNKSV